MLKVDPFEHLDPGALVSIDVGENVSLAFRVDRTDPARRRVHLQIEGDERAAEGVEFVDWRVYMLTRQHRMGGSGPVAVSVPTELRELSRAPLRLELEVLDGTALMQRRSLYRTSRPGIQARVRVDGAATAVAGDVLDLSASGLALSTHAAPPAPGAGLALDVLLPTGQSLPARGHLVGAAARGEGGHDWRWNVQFDELAAPVRDALRSYIHLAQP
jgi:hypothetical protein